MRTDMRALHFWNMPLGGNRRMKAIALTAALSHLGKTQAAELYKIVVLIRILGGFYLGYIYTEMKGTRPRHVQVLGRPFPGS